MWRALRHRKPFEVVIVKHVLKLCVLRAAGMEVEAGGVHERVQHVPEPEAHRHRESGGQAHRIPRLPRGWRCAAPLATPLLPITLPPGPARSTHGTSWCCQIGFLKGLRRAAGAQMASKRYTWLNGLLHRKLLIYSGLTQVSVCAASVLATLPAAFTAAQQALGVIHFESALNEKPSTKIAADPAGCLPAAAQSRTAMEHVRRQLRCDCQRVQAMKQSMFHGLQ